MRLTCWYCRKSVSTEIPDDTLVRAVCVCPECLPRVMMIDEPVDPPVDAPVIPTPAAPDEQEPPRG